MASRADDRTAEDLRQRFLRLHSVDHEDLWHLYLPADVSDGSDALSGATYDLQLQNDLAMYLYGVDRTRCFDPRKRSPSRRVSAPSSAELNGRPAFLRDKKKKILSRTIAAMVDAEVMKQNSGGSFYVKYSFYPPRR